MASLGKRVLLLDLDIQNSLSFWFVQTQDDARNVASAMFTGNLKANIIPCAPMIDICQSDFSLIKLRSIPQGTVGALLRTVENDYDYCLIDCPPTWDGIIISAIKAADLVIVPCRLKSMFTLKSLKFYLSVLADDVPDALSRVAVVFNYYHDDKEALEFIRLYESVHNQFFDSRLPQTNAQMKDAITYAKAHTFRDVKKWNVLYPFVHSFYAEIAAFFGEEAAPDTQPELAGLLAGQTAECDA